MVHLSHSYRLTRTRQIGYFCAGLAIVVFAYAALNMAVFSLGQQDPTSGFLFVSAFFSLVCISIVGVFLVAVTIFTQVTTTPDHLAYHTPFLIVSAQWQCLQVFQRHGRDKNSLVVIPTEGTVTLRPWAKIAPWVFRKDPTRFVIDTSHFRNAEDHSLELEINIFLIRQDKI